MPKSVAPFVLAEVLPRLQRTAFVPTLVRITDDPDCVDDEVALGVDDVLAAKIGGTPFLSADAPAPSCGKCKQPLAFVLQLRRSDLPVEAQATLTDELLQLFWCNDCQSQGGAENAWSKGVVIREIPLGTPVAPVVAPKDDDDDDEPEPLSVTFIRDWQPVVDHPVGLADVLAGVLGVSAKSDAMREQLDELGNAMSEAELESLGGLKLAGWPRWVADPETVKCKCKAVMAPVIQLGDDAVVVGDGGTTWIVACPACHKKAYISQQ